MITFLLDLFVQNLTYLICFLVLSPNPPLHVFMDLWIHPLTADFIIQGIIIPSF